MSLLLKVFIMLEGTSRSPDFSLAALLQPYQAQIVRQQLSARRWRRRIRRAFQDWNRLLNVLPSDLADILGQLKRGRFWPFGCQFTRCRRADGRFGWFWNASRCPDVLCDRLSVNVQLPGNTANPPPPLV